MQNLNRSQQLQENLDPPPFLTLLWQIRMATSKWTSCSNLKQANPNLLCRKPSPRVINSLASRSHMCFSQQAFCFYAPQSFISAQVLKHICYPPKGLPWGYVQWVPNIKSSPSSSKLRGFWSCLSYAVGMSTCTGQSCLTFKYQVPFRATCFKEVRTGLHFCS